MADIDSKDHRTSGPGDIMKGNPIRVTHDPHLGDDVGHDEGFCRFGLFFPLNVSPLNYCHPIIGCRWGVLFLSPC